MCENHIHQHGGLRKSNTEENRKLIQMAKKVMENAYAPYSKFKVGSALLAKNGEVFTGCNVENKSYGVTNCAERTAIFKAISEGNCDFEKIAIVSVSDDITYPCFICRQVMVEHMPKGILLFEDKHGDIYELSMAEATPYSFDTELPE